MNISSIKNIEITKNIVNNMVFNTVDTMDLYKALKIEISFESWVHEFKIHAYNNMVTLHRAISLCNCMYVGISRRKAQSLRRYFIKCDKYFYLWST